MRNYEQAACVSLCVCAHAYSVTVDGARTGRVESGLSAAAEDGVEKWHGAGQARARNRGAHQDEGEPRVPWFGESGKHNLLCLSSQKIHHQVESFPLVQPLSRSYIEEYDAMNEQATKERRKLDSEVVETTEATQVRLEKAARDDQIKSDVKAIESAFFCQDCQKQYKTVKEMENHLSSYDHHHRKRLQELKKSSLSTDELELKRKREQQHEAMVLQKRIENAAAAAADSSVAQSQKESSTSSAVDNTLQRGKLATTKIGFSFGGKAKAKGTVGAFGAKKSPKKIMTLASAFASP